MFKTITLVFILFLKTDAMNNQCLLKSAFRKHFNITCVLNVLEDEGYTKPKFLCLKEFSSWSYLTSQICQEARNRCYSAPRLLAFSSYTKISTLKKVDFQQCDIDNILLIILIDHLKFDDLELLLEGIYISINCRFIIANPDLLGYSLIEVYRISSKSQLLISNQGFWNQSNGLTFSFGNIFLQRNNLRGVELKFVVTNVPPFMEILTFLDKKNNTITEINGIGYNLWKVIASSLNISFQNIIMENTFGSRLGNGSWTGILGAIYRNEVDVEHGIIMRNDRRECGEFLHVDFSEMYMIFVKPVKGSKITKWLAYFVPFEYSIWFCLFILILLISFLDSIFCILIKNKRWSLITNWISSLISTFGAFCQQGSHQQRSDLLSARIKMLTMYICFMLTYVCYSSEIISSLVFEDHTMAFNDLKSLMDFGGYTIHCHKDSPVLALVHNSSQAELRRFYTEYLKPELSSLPSIQEGLTRMLYTPKYAFIALEPFGKRFFQKHNTYVIHFPLMKNRFLISTLVAKNSPYKRFLNQKILKIREFGIYSRIKSGDKRKEYIDEGIFFNSIDLYMISVPLIILCLGYLLGFLIIVFEIKFFIYN